MVHDLVSSQQHMQNNMQANNDVVHKIQDAQQEQKSAMDMLAKQMSQLATSLNEMRENEGRIPASVKSPDRENISQITLRSGRGYEGPVLKDDGSTPPEVNKEKESIVPNQRDTEERSTKMEDDLQRGDLEKSLPHMADPFFLDPDLKWKLKK